MKRHLATALIAAMAVSVISGCGMTTSTTSSSSSAASSETAASEDSDAADSTSAAEEAAEEDSQPESGDATKLKMMLVGTDSDAWVTAYRQIIENFNADNEYGVTIDAEFIANADYKTKLTTLMASDSEPDIIFTWELGYLENFVNGDKIIDLQPYLDADEDWKNSFNGGTLDQLTYEGDVYGIPTQSCIAIMYYNTDIFEQYGLEVPTTYEEYRTICDTLLENGVTPIALASTAEDAWLVSQYIQQLSNSIAGYELYDSLKNGTGAWNDEAFVQAGTLFQEEVDAGYYEDGFTGVSGAEAKQMFMDGKTAMYFNGSWEITNVTSDNSSIKDTVSCFGMPAVDEANTGVSVGSVDTSFAITKNCGNIDAAVAFLKYWTSAENAQMLFYDYGRMPSTNCEIDESKLNSLNVDCKAVLNEQSSLTPWLDRMDTDMGNEFNNICVSISNGDDPQEMFDSLQSYYESNQ